jgi:NTE family protein
VPERSTTRAVNQFAASRAVIWGVPGFFTPRMPPSYLLPVGGGATSYYDVKNLRSTIERLIDFDRINAKAMRFSVGAVNVRTGNFIYFDNETHTIRPEHIMASCALPPAFDAIEVDGEFYWDGGMVSNTPLDRVLSERIDLDTLVLQVDLWSARGALPRNLAEVAVRMKEVQFSSRTRAASDEFYRIKRLQAAFNELLTQMPVELAATPQAQLLRNACESAVYNIVQLIYRSAAYEGQSKDYEFSRRTMEDHWRAGYADATTTLAHPEIFALPTTAQGVAVYDYLTSPPKTGPR